VHHITMLGSGLIGMFYTKTLHGRRSRDEVRVVFSRTAGRARQFAGDWGIRDWTTNMEDAINHPDTDVVVIGLPNSLHEEATIAAAAAGKAVLCTKPLGRTAAEAKRMLDAVERAGVFAGYLEDLVYTPDTLKAVQAVRDGALGRVLWVRSRETHGGPHSEWFWDREIAGGGAIVDMGCHCIEIGRSFIGKEVRPLEVMCWADTQVHPITAEDSAVGLVRYATGAVAQFEVSWTFRGGMDLRDEVSGAEGSIRLDHWLRTGHEMFTAARDTGYVSEKAESETGWLFPVGDEIGRLGYVEMFADMLDALDTHEPPLETFYDGYVVNAVMDAAYRSVASKQWEPVALDDWRGSDDAAGDRHVTDYDADHLLIKRERMPDGTTKLILKEKHTGAIVQRVI